MISGPKRRLRMGDECSVLKVASMSPSDVGMLKRYLRNEKPQQISLYQHDDCLSNCTAKRDVSFSHFYIVE